MEHWSVEDYKNYATSGKIPKANNRYPKKNKYNATKTSVDGHTFDSRREADYYCELKLKLRANEIDGFCLQPTFVLAPNLKYKADFIVFHNDAPPEVIDVKGFKTKEYITKKKIFEEKFNLKITEI